MSEMKKLHTKRRRRQRSQSLKHGKKAKPVHRAKTGRTGIIFSKKTPSKSRFEYHIVLPFAIPRSIQQLLASLR